MPDHQNKKTPDSRKADRLEREAQALRQNLLKRKLQGRERTLEKKEEPEEEGSK